MLNTALVIVVAISVGYLLGSVPFGYLVCRVRGINPLTEGSGSTGATNVLRLAGKGPAFTVLLGDFTKGLVAPTVAGWAVSTLSSSPPSELISSLVAVLAAAGALVGHVWSLWLGGRGGKAVATGVGTPLALDWRVGLAVALTWLITVKLSRISSLGALVAVPLAAVYMYLSQQFLVHSPAAQLWCYVLYCIVGAAYIVYKHQANIERLLAGTEPKVGDR